MYGHVIAKFSRMGSLPHFPTNGAALRARAPLLSVYWCCFLTSLSREILGPNRLREPHKHKRVPTSLSRNNSSNAWRFPHKHLVALTLKDRHLVQGRIQKFQKKGAEEIATRTLTTLENHITSHHHT